jgi:hypothetical protein
MSEENLEIVRGVRTVLPPLSDRASERRTLDERLCVRFPALYRLLADFFDAAPAVQASAADCRPFCAAGIRGS